MSHFFLPAAHQGVFLKKKKVSFPRGIFKPASKIMEISLQNNIPTNYWAERVSEEIFHCRIQMSLLHFTSKSDHSSLIWFFLTARIPPEVFNCRSEVPRHSRIHPLPLTSCSADESSARVTSSLDKVDDLQIGLHASSTSPRRYFCHTTGNSFFFHLTM